MIASTAGTLQFGLSGAGPAKIPFQAPGADTLYIGFRATEGQWLPPIDLTFNFRADGFILSDPLASNPSEAAWVDGAFSVGSLQHGYEITGHTGFMSVHGGAYGQFHLRPVGALRDGGYPSEWFFADPATGYVDTGIQSVAVRLHPDYYDWGTAQKVFAVQFSTSAQGFLTGQGELDFMHTFSTEIELPAGTTFTTASGLIPNVRYVDVPEVNSLWSCLVLGLAGLGFVHRRVR